MTESHQVPQEPKVTEPAGYYSWVAAGGWAGGAPEGHPQLQAASTNPS